MITFPNAKINLGLHITQKRKDGYHEIESCMVPIPLSDALEMILDKKPSWTVTGLEVPGDPKDNLILKAEKLLKKDYQGLPSLQIHLHKHIPMGAGLGGGSADGAFALKLMNNLFDLHLDDFFLEEYAAELGSDCPFFIENTPKIIRGRGEILEPSSVSLQGSYLVLIYPGIHVGTKEAYAGVVPKAPKTKLETILADRSRWKGELEMGIRVGEKLSERRVLVDEHVHNLWPFSKIFLGAEIRCLEPAHDDGRTLGIQGRKFRKPFLQL